MAVLTFTGAQIQSFLDSGAVNAGGKVYFYSPGTTTLKNAYTNKNATVATANPLILDSAGRGVAWMSGLYKIRVETSAGVLVGSEVDNVGETDSSIATDSDNLIVNASFETDTNGDLTPDSWTSTLDSGATIARITTDARHGAACMKFTDTGSGGGYITSTDFFECATSMTYAWALDLYSDGATVRNLARIYWYKRDQTASATASTDIYDNSTTTPTAWTRVNGTVTPPSDATYGKFRFYGSETSGATGVTYLDNVVVRENFGAYSSTTLTKTTNYTTVAPDNNDWIEVDTTAGNVIITYLSAVTGGDGYNVGVIKTSSDANYVIISIGGSTVRNLYLQNEACQYRSNGTSYRLIDNIFRNTPRCSVYKTAAQTVAAAATNLVTFGTEDYDYGASWDNAAHRFTVRTGDDGSYAVYINTTTTSGDVGKTTIYKNGAAHKRVISATGVSGSGGAIKIDLVAGDYIEVYNDNSAGAGGVVYSTTQSHSYLVIERTTIL